MASPPEALDPKCWAHLAILCQPLGSPTNPVKAAPITVVLLALGSGAKTVPARDHTVHSVSHLPPAYPPTQGQNLLTWTLPWTASLELIIV